MLERLTRSSNTDLVCIFITNFSLLTLLSFIAYTYHPGRLLVGIDGPLLASLSEVQQTFFGLTTSIHSSILQGLSNTSTASLNLSLLPPIMKNGVYDPVFFYIVFSLQLFVSTLLLGWAYRFPAHIYYTAAWGLTILAFPYFSTLRIYSITESATHFIVLISSFTMMTLCITRVGYTKGLQTLVYGGGFLLGLVWLLIIFPVGILMLAPVLFLTTLCAILTLPRHAVRRVMIIGLMMLIIAFLSGWIHYIVGMLLNAAVYVYSSDFTGLYQSNVYTSILFHKNVPHSAMGPWLFGLAVIGELLAIWRSNTLRPLAITVLIGQALLLGVGCTLMSLSKPWNGLSPIYLEFLLLPFYALFAIYCLSLCFSMFSIRYFFNTRTYNLLLPFLITTPLVVLILTNPPSIHREASYTMPPTTNSPIIRVLEENIAITPFTDFKGRVANILIDQDQVAQTAYAFQLDQLTGNDHQSTGLWLRHIPTLHEYNQFISPGFYAIYHHFLVNPHETISRNWTNFSRFNLKVLQLLGVRYVISTASKVQDVKKVARLTIPAEKKLPELDLYELPGVNLTGLSVNKLIISSQIQEALKQMASNDFTLNTAIIFSPLTLTQPLHPILKSRLRVEKNGFHFTAISSGQSLVVLPLEFSHCLQSTVLTGKQPKLIRTNIALTGVLFDSEVDILLDNSTGPFDIPTCKLTDALEFKKLLGQSK